MKVDNRLTKQRVAKSLLQKRHIVALIIIIVVVCALWFTLHNLNTQTVMLWESGSLAHCFMTPELESSLKKLSQELGVDKLTVLIRSPEDAYYDTAFSTSGLYSTDIFILDEKQFLPLLDDDVFVDLTTSPLAAFQHKGYFVEGKLVAICVAEGKYMAISTHSNVELNVLYQLAQLIAQASEV